LTIGSPLEEATQFGPVANKQHQQKLAGFFDLVHAQGNTIVHGGKLIDGPDCYVVPTVILANSLHVTCVAYTKSSCPGRRPSRFIDRR
jgi:phenylacetaldehyde dehydrogenase